MKNVTLKLSGILNLTTALLHTVAGQYDLINPILTSDLGSQAKSELVGVWHMITVLLFTTSFILLKAGFGKFQHEKTKLVKPIGWLYVLLSIPSMVTSLAFFTLVPQWILLLPIGLLCLYKSNKPTINT